MWLLILLYLTAVHLLKKLPNFYTIIYNLLRDQVCLILKTLITFCRNLKNLKKVPGNAIFVTTDVVGLFPSISYNEGLEILKKQFDNFVEKSKLTEDLVKMAEFVSKNNYFEFNSNVKCQICVTVIGTKFSPPYACIYI